MVPPSYKQNLVSDSTLTKVSRHSAPHCKFISWAMKELGGLVTGNYALGATPGRCTSTLVTIAAPGGIISLCVKCCPIDSEWPDTCCWTVSGGTILPLALGEIWLPNFTVGRPLDRKVVETPLYLSLKCIPKEILHTDFQVSTCRELFEDVAFEKCPLYISIPSYIYT